MFAALLIVSGEEKVRSREVTMVSSSGNMGFVFILTTCPPGGGVVLQFV